jgi:hypothetical protein
MAFVNRNACRIVGHYAEEKRKRPAVSSAASRQLQLEWANVFRLPPLRSFGDFEFHGLTLLQALKPTCLDRRKMHENVLARLTADKAVAFGVVKPLYCSLFHDVAGIPFDRFVLERDSEVLAAGYWLIRQELLTTDSV